MERFGFFRISSQYFVPQNFIPRASLFVHRCCAGEGSLTCTQLPRVRSPVRWGFLIKLFFPGIRRDGGAEPQSLVSVPNILPQYVDIKAYVLLISICSSNGDLSLAAPLVFLEKSRLMPALILAFIPLFLPLFSTVFPSNSCCFCPVVFSLL